MNPNDAKSTFLLEHCAERCEGYQNDDACETCEINAAIKAIEKQIPKKPVFDSGPFHFCPTCIDENKTVSYDFLLDRGQTYCRRCGQRILWEVEE